MSTALTIVRTASVGALLAAFAAPVMAGSPAAPGPMIGAGAPALAVFAAGYWLVRRRRRG